MITRRRFAAIAGLTAAHFALRPGWGQSHAVEHPQDEDHPKTAPKPAPAKLAAHVEAPAPAKADSPKVNRATATPEEIWNDLMEGNKRFASGKTAARDVIGAWARTSNSQHPYVIVLCCSDSRLSPELIFDQNIGELFVVRTAGNVADPIALGSMEYAVEHLGARMLVVLGHEKCGAVSASLSGEEMPTSNLAALVDKIRPGIERLKALVRGDALMSLAVEANVHQSTASVIESSPIIRHEIASGSLAVVKAVYKLGPGEVVRLEASFK